MKNPYKVQTIFSQNSRKDRMTHFNISVAVKRRSQWSALFRIFRNVKPLTMLLTNIKFSVFQNIKGPFFYWMVVQMLILACFNHLGARYEKMQIRYFGQNNAKVTAI